MKDIPQSSWLTFQSVEVMKKQGNTEHLLLIEWDKRDTTEGNVWFWTVSFYCKVCFLGQWWNLNGVWWSDDGDKSMLISWLRYSSCACVGECPCLQGKHTEVYRGDKTSHQPLLPTNGEKKVCTVPATFL